MEPDSDLVLKAGKAHRRQVCDRQLRKDGTRAGMDKSSVLVPTGAGKEMLVWWCWVGRGVW